jgi:predicted phosphodiesterase
LLALDEGSPLDLNREFRDGLEEDARAFVNETSKLDALLIGGDIAATGQEHQFRVAEEWIERLCGIIGCTHKDVYCVPGNHDIDRERTTDNGLVQLAESVFRTCPIDQIDSHLVNILAGSKGADDFISRLDNYHEFAARYDCGVTPKEYCWKREMKSDLEGRSVVLVGLNSALISSGQDGSSPTCGDAEKLILGKGQAYLHRNDDSIVVALVHHPLSWIRDRQSVEGRLARAQVQLYGHEHKPAFDSDDQTVQIYAGAVQPPAGETMRSPAFNFVELAIEGDELVVQTRPRKWNGTGFAADPEFEDPVEKRVKLREPTTIMEEPDEVSTASDIRREAMWQLMQRSRGERRAVLARLGVAAEDEVLTPLALGEAVKKIADQNLWEQLNEELNR